MKNKGSSLLFVIITIFILSISMLILNTYILSKASLNLDNNDIIKKRIYEKRLERFK
ncbi:hypothetical protein [Oceanivirga salmonicida]|uniref:hypothetical protein n=1 Tax=Oceanivirga salmonicida TaxID=1769291 RepID=UPI0012E1F516|nr:hypothetical protein [Oceanivirga salmonicida]